MTNVVIINIKVNFSLYSITHHAMKFQAFLTSSQDGSEWIAPCAGTFTTGDTIP
jgi:hypothetical protein